jgi:hypothetical protein
VQKIAVRDAQKIVVETCHHVRTNSSQGGKNPLAPPSRSRRAAAKNGALPAAFAAPLPQGLATGDPNRQASSSALPQRTSARSTGGDRPSGTDMERVAAARTTWCYRKSVPGTTKHTVCSRTRTHEHQGLWWKALGSQLGTALGTKGGPVQRMRRYSKVPWEQASKKQYSGLGEIRRVCISPGAGAGGGIRRPTCGHEIGASPARGVKRRVSAIPTQTSQAA